MSPKNLLERQRLLIIERIYPEVHPLVEAPHFWSGNGRHTDFKTPQSLQKIFTKREHISTTSFSTLLKTTCKGITLVQKQFHPVPQRDNAAFLKAIEELGEMEHRHLILILRSFTEKANLLSLLMYPYAPFDLELILNELDTDGDQLTDLGEQLGIVSGSNPEEIRFSFSKYLQRMYGCLINAVEYLHSQGVYVKEFKTEHILLRPEGPCLTDFGLLKPVPFIGANEDIYRYDAPEVGLRAEPTAKSNIYSLGCCFLEICTVINGVSLQDLRKVAAPSRMLNIGKSAYKYNLGELSVWIGRLRATRQSYDHSLPYTELDLFELMIRENESSRPTARKTIFYFNCLEGGDDASTRGYLYHEVCCRPRRFETAERIEAELLLMDTLSGLGEQNVDVVRQLPSDRPAGIAQSPSQHRTTPEYPAHGTLPEVSPNNAIPNPSPEAAIPITLPTTSSLNRPLETARYAPLPTRNSPYRPLEANRRVPLPTADRLNPLPGPATTIPIPTTIDPDPHLEPVAPTPLPATERLDPISGPAGQIPPPTSATHNPPTGANNILYNTAEQLKVNCPVAACPARFIVLIDFYDHLYDTHTFWLSDAHKYKCLSCPEAPRVSLKAFVEHLEQIHPGPEKVAVFNSAVYDELCKNAGFGAKWKLVTPARGIVPAQRA